MNTPLGYLVFVLTLWKYCSFVAGLVYNIEMIPNARGHSSITLKDVRPKIAHGEQYYSTVTTAQKYVFLKPQNSGSDLYKYVLRIVEGDGSFGGTYEGNKDKELEVYRQIPFPTTDCTYFRVKGLTREDWNKAKLVGTDPVTENSPPCRYSRSSGGKDVPLSSAIAPQIANPASKQSKVNIEKCPICLEKLGDGVDVKSLACKHAFHKECIKEWVSKNPTCPLCRAPVNEAKVIALGVPPRAPPIRRDDDYSNHWSPQLAYFH